MKSKLTILTLKSKQLAFSLVMASVLFSDDVFSHIHMTSHW